jgi:hypothetical protein
MSSRWSLLLFALIPLGGCSGLQEGPTPSGHQLFHGNHIESPGFITVGDETMVRFEDRLAYATTSQGGVSDLWISSFDGTSQRKVVANRSDYWGEQGPDNAGDRYFMVDEHLVASGGSSVRAGSLVRLSPTLDEEFRLEGISLYTRISVSIGALYDSPPPGKKCPGFPTLENDCPQLLYERPLASGQSLPTLMLWDGTNHLPLGADSGSFQMQQAGNNLYFLLDDTHTLTRFKRPSYTLDSLRSNVSRFSVSGDEHYVALVVTDNNKTVVRDLQTGAEIVPARPNPSGWGVYDKGLFGDRTFYYSQNATSSAPAELHSLDLVTGKDTFDVLPTQLANWAGTINRNDDERLLLDSNGSGVFTGRNDLVARRSLAGPLKTPSFTPDGAYLIYVNPSEPTLYDTTVKGPLMFQDADHTDLSATMVSPSGLLVEAQYGASYQFIGDKGNILMFSAHLGRASSDLYFADYQDGALPTGLRLIAKSIHRVFSASEHSLFGILNMSQQDAVGDLVYRDIDKDVDTLYAQAVSESAQLGGSDLSTSYAAYIIRGRVAADRCGLWLTTMAPPVTPDGGTH